MGLIKIRILITFYIYLLSSTSTSYILGEFPSIRPVPCQNRMTGESGVCTFNWSCKNVAHGIHVGYCVDRFFVGSCCKIPDEGRGNRPINSIGGNRPINSFSLSSSTNTSSGASSSASAGSNSYGAAQTTKENIQVEPLREIPDAPPRPTIQERVKIPIPTRVNSNNNINSPIHNIETSTDAIKRSQTSSSSSLNRKPVLPALLSTTSSSGGNNFLTNIETSGWQEKFTSVISGVKLPTFSPVKEEYSTTSYFQQYNSSASESSHEQITAQERTNENISSQSYEKRNPTSVSESSHALHPFFSYDTQDQKWPVSDEKGDNHQISFVLEDPPIKHSSQFDQHAHKENIPSDTFFTWSYSILSNENKDIIKTEINSSATEAKLSISNLPSSDISSSSNPSHHHVSGSQHEVNNDSNTSDSTANEIDSAPTTAENLLDLGNSVNIDKVSLNFTKFTEPHYPWPSAKPTSKDPAFSSSETATISDVSRVCGRSRSTIMARIVGGRKSHYLRWPWMISLRRFEGKTFKHKCGAALLNQLWAITAAHCVDGKLPNDIILRLGEYNFHRMDESHPHVERRIYMIVIHPEFDPATYENDLALLRFYEPVRFKANIVPVCLPKFTGDISGRTAVVTGWGRLSEEGELPGSLHEVQMPILTNKECEEMYSQAGYSETIRDVFVCAGLTSGGLDACEGDSGGPMVVTGDRGQWMLVGLISWGMGCAAPRQPGVYTRITKFVDWIDEIITY